MESSCSWRNTGAAGTRAETNNNISSSSAASCGGRSGRGSAVAAAAQRGSALASHHGTTVVQASSAVMAARRVHDQQREKSCCLKRQPCSYFYGHSSSSSPITTATTTITIATTATTATTATPRRPHPLDKSLLHALLSLALLVLACTSLLGAATAHETTNAIDRRSALSAAALVDDLTQPWTGAALVVDTRPPPLAPLMPLRRRQDQHASPSTPSKSAVSSKTALKTEPSATQSAFVVPVPFDSSLANNFTASCATFWSRLLNDDSFRSCHPLSLMLQTSSSFFDATKSYIRITQTLEATCAADLTKCKNVMDGLARDIVSDSNCAVDYSNDNPQVLQAYNGLIAYEPLYQAGCLQDGEGNYCYANAVTNTSATTDAYPYYLPLGVEMSGGSRPTCNACLQNSMAIFSAFAGNSSQPISKTYNSAAAQIQVGCGPNFVNKTALPLKGAASTMTVTATPSFTLLSMLLLYLLQ